MLQIFIYLSSRMAGVMLFPCVTHHDAFHSVFSYIIELIREIHEEVIEKAWNYMGITLQIQITNSSYCLLHGQSCDKCSKTVFYISLNYAYLTCQWSSDSNKIISYVSPQEKVSQGMGVTFVQFSVSSPEPRIAPTT